MNVNHGLQLPDCGSQHAQSNLELGHFLSDDLGKNCGSFTFNERDLVIHCTREINLQDQPAQVTVSHCKIPGLSWIIFIYQLQANQYQPRIAYDFPTYLRADCELLIELAGMSWVVKHKFEGSSWLTNSLQPKTLNDRWCNPIAMKQIEVKVTVNKIWFKFPLFVCCCHPLQTKREGKQIDFQVPDTYSDLQILPNDTDHRRLFVHAAILSLNSPVLYERLKSTKIANAGQCTATLSLPFTYEQVITFLKAIYPNSKLEINRENVEDLMEICKSYHVTKILRRCEKYLYKELECGSPVLVYYLAQKFELRDLQNAALLQLADMNHCQLNARVNLDMKHKGAEALSVLLNDILQRI
ncbi:hypothetical protein Ciccas_001650 [Cichlidogyrus casuarinus]|uniref:BTB domain-containing protein n=1 Tax=Cichlidogyrus casuarinus TaxID=1844966 RepID=A0ABD2QJJ9_9PLAT